MSFQVKTLKITKNYRKCSQVPMKSNLECLQTGKEMEEGTGHSEASGAPKEGLNIFILTLPFLGAYVANDFHRGIDDKEELNV